MFNKSILEFVKILAQKEESFSPTLMLKIWNEAEKAKEVSLMADIALRSDMPDEVLKKAKAKKEILIKIAYLSRKNISKEELREALTTEVRAGVLSGVFENIELEVAKANIDIFFDHFKKKPTKALAEAMLLKVDAVGDDFAALIVSELASKERSLTDDQGRGYRKLLVKAIRSKVYLEKVVTNLSEQTLESNALEFVRVNGTSEVIIDKVVEATIKRYQTEAKTMSDSPNNYYRRICYTIARNAESLLQENNVLLGEKVIKALDEFPIPDEESSKLIASYIDRFNKFKAGDTSEEIEIASTGGPEMIIDLLSKVDKNNTVLSENDILVYIAKNPNSDKIIGKLMDYSDRYAREDIYSRILGVASTKLFIHLYLSRFDEMVKLDNWKSLGGESDGTKLLVASFANEFMHPTDEDTYSNSYRARSAGYELIDYVKDFETLKALPWSFLTDILHSSYYYNDRIKKVSALVASTLDSYNTIGGSWDTFSVIAEGFQGSLAELAETSLTI